MIRGLLALVGAAGAFGATPQATPDVDATLTVRLAAGKPTYAVGELIPLELEFRGRAEPDWYFSTVGDGLWGGAERYVVTPAGGHEDPFAEYFASVGVVGSILSGWQALDGTPFVVRTRLNDRVRFTKPGDYRLVVESSRLERYSRKPAPALVSDTLVSLVEPPVAGLDDALSARYASAASPESEAAAMSLVARYGSRRLLLLVLEALDRGADCELEAAAIEYLLEHDKAVAQRRLQPAFARGRGQCASPPWSQLAPRRWDETVEAAALAHLGSRDDRLVIDAARALETYGSARVKEPLLARFAAWRAEWRAREAELEALAAGPSAFDSPLVLENSLANALLNGRSFALTDDELARIRGLCVTTGCRGNVDARPRSRGKR